MSESSIRNYKGKKIMKEEEPNDEWANPTNDDNVILGNYKGIKVQNELKDFHEEMREIHYSLNYNSKLLCSMVEPLAKAAV
ncbi:hypothetical protein Tco_1065621 [Tanacetum coccineum]